MINMALVKKLSVEELKMVEGYIDAYATRESSRSVDGEYILRIWDEAKSEYLYKMFGEQFIISRNVEFKKGCEEMSHELGDMIFGYHEDEDHIGYRAKMFIDAYCNMLNDKYYRTNEYYSLRRLVDFTELATNVYEGETCELTVDLEKPIKVQHGCKNTRVLGKIADAYKLPHFEDFRLAHSQILNQKKLKGVMCLSIHPLDYITMSDNTYDWCSCMSWEDDGCYKQGTVEMMNSPMVVVAYLNGTDTMQMPGTNERWNSKKWRQLFIVNPNMIGNIKAYPYSNDELTQFVLTWLKELAEQAHIGKYTEKIVKYSTYREFNLKEFGNRAIEVRPYTYQMYNDFSDKQFAYFGETIEAGTYSFCYSGISECMACGSTDCGFDNESMLVGTCCEESYYCECCEDLYHDRDELIEVDGRLVCRYCLENYYAEDDLTSELHHYDDMTSVFLAPDDGSGFFMHRCFKVYAEDLSNEVVKPYFTKFHRAYQNDHNILYVQIKDCTEKGLLDIFGYTSFEEAYSDEYNIVSNYTQFFNFPKEEIIDNWDNLIYRYRDDPKKMVAIKIN